MATPDPGKVISERFLGSNDENYAVLRTECENPGSYFETRTKVWLVEHSKAPAPGSQPRMTLIIDETNHIDANDYRNRTTELHFKDRDTTLGDLIGRLELTELVPWTPEQIAALRFDPVTGRTEFKSQLIWEGSGRKAETDEAEIALMEVAEDPNCIFLTIDKGGDQNRETTLVCIPASIAHNVHALRELEPFHLSAGSFSTAKEALSICDSLQKITTSSGCGPLQVWLVLHADTGKTDYAVVMKETASFLRGDLLGTKQQRTDQPDWLPISSEGFRELVVGPTP